MEQQVSNQVGGPSNTQSVSAGISEGRRNCWIVSGYVASLLTVAIVLAYYFSSYVTR